MEAGHRRPSPDLLARLFSALPQLPSPEDGAGNDALVPVSGAETSLEGLDEAGADLAVVRMQVEELQARARRLEEEATICPNTGVKNRRALDSALPRAVAAAHRRGEPVAVVLMDIDHFKPINDRHGHDMGDEVLKAFAPAMAAIVRERERDEFCRMGGDEFVAVLENCGLQQARVIAERLRTRAAELEVCGLNLSISVGVASFRAPRSPVADDGVRQIVARLLKEADQALYAAKAAGRNRVKAFDGALTLTLPSASPMPRWRASLQKVAVGGRLGLLALSLSLVLSSGAADSSSKGCGGAEQPKPCPPGTISSNGQCISPEPPACAGNECTDR